MVKNDNTQSPSDKNDFFDESKGPYAALGGPLYIKKILGKATYLIQASDSSITK